MKGQDKILEDTLRQDIKEGKDEIKQERKETEKDNIRYENTTKKR